MTFAQRSTALQAHVSALHACQRCPEMHRPAVSGGPVMSRVVLIGQAPGAKEPVLGRPFAWTAGKTLFRWFEGACGVDEATFRSSVYMAAVCRCFPGKNKNGGDRVPAPDEIRRCSEWLAAEFRLLRPELVLAVGKLAISQFLPPRPLVEMIGRQERLEYAGVPFDFIALPHPSGASPWHRMEPGKSLLGQALELIRHHPAWEARLTPPPGEGTLSLANPRRSVKR